jgi:hypothetical protein
MPPTSKAAVLPQCLRRLARLLMLIQVQPPPRVRGLPRRQRQRLTQRPRARVLAQLLAHAIEHIFPDLTDCNTP